MYEVVFYSFNKKKSKTFETIEQAFAFWQRLPFQSFSEMYKL
jgi:hypothetical protein